MELLNALTVARGNALYLQPFHDVACLSSDIVGNPVCVRGDRVNGKWRVETANPFYDTKMPAIGILVSKSTPTVGVIQIWGAVENVYTGLDFMAPSYMIGDAGITPIPPMPGINGYVWVQHIGKAVASDILLLSGNLLMRKGK